MDCGINHWYVFRLRKSAVGGQFGPYSPELGPVSPNVYGTPGNDTFTGTANADCYLGRAGNDVISGAGGDDELYGEEGNDTINGGPGNDTIEDLLGVNTLNGDAGDDVLTGRGTLDGGAGDDELYGSGFDDRLEGGAGDDRLLAGNGRDILIGGPGADHLSGGIAARPIDSYDTADYSASPAGINVNLRKGTGAGGDAEGDSLAYINRLVGSAHADTLTGNWYDNLLEGGAGADTLDGGDGNDGADYSGSNAGVVVNLATNTNSGGHAAGDTLKNIESLRGSAHVDNLTGDDGDNTLYGSGGFDWLDGGDGFDTVSYAFMGQGVEALLRSTSRTTGDALVKIEKVIGSPFRDSLFGSDEDDVIEGGGGNDLLGGIDGDDQISGGPGNDIIAGDEGRDTIDGGPGNDTIDGGPGRDTLDGGDGIDVVMYRQSAAAVTINLATRNQRGGDAQGDALTNFENVKGSRHADNITGNNAANLLRGDDGNDTLRGQGGDDTLAGGDGNDTLTGGAGVDRFFFDESNFGSDVITDYQLGAQKSSSDQIYLCPLALTDPIAVRNRVKYEVADSGSNSIITVWVRGSTSDPWEEAGTITLRSRTTRSANWDNRIIHRVPFTDPVAGTCAPPADPTATPPPPATPDGFSLTAADGSITLSWTDTGDGSLTHSYRQRTISSSGTEGAWGDWIAISSTPHTISSGLNANTNYNFELRAERGSRLSASPASRTGVYGTSGNDTISGTTFVDYITALGGNDTITGGAGDDIIIGGAGGDSMDGGAGYDLVSYRTASAAIVLDLRTTGNKTGDAAGDTFANIECYEGTRFNDRIGDVQATPDAVCILGGAGDDEMWGHSGTDTLSGGAGNDKLHGGGGADKFRFFASFGADTISDYADNEDLILCMGTDATDTGAASGGNWVVTVSLGGTQQGTITLTGRTNGTNVDIVKRATTHADCR